MALGVREAWRELRAELEGMGWVLLAGSVGPISAWLAMVAMALPFLIPLPLALASARVRGSRRAGPAIALGALLGFSLVKAFLASPLYPPFYRWANRGWPAPNIEEVPLACRACTPSLSMAALLLVFCIILALPLLPIPIAWILLSAYPAYVAWRGLERVPRLLLLMYAIALLANSLACALCSLSSGDALGSVAMVFDSALSLALAALCLLRAWAGGGGGRGLLAFLTFYVLLCSPWILWMVWWEA